MAAFVAYIALPGSVFTYQTLNLIREWAGGSPEAFGRFPKSGNSQILAYAVVSLTIFGAALGLVHLGGRLSARRRTRRVVDLEPTPA